MLARLLGRPLHLRFVTFLPLTVASTNQPFPSSRALFHFLSFSSLIQPPVPLVPTTWALLHHPRAFSSNSDGDDTWKFSSESEEPDSIFAKEEGTLSGIPAASEDAFGLEEAASTAAGSFTSGGSPWVKARSDERDIFEGIGREVLPKDSSGDGEWETAEGYKPWTFGDGEEKENVFGIGDETQGIGGLDEESLDQINEERDEEQEKLQQREQELLTILKGPNRAFGDLIAQSGITEDMIDSLILLKDVRCIKGLPPLSEIEDAAIAKLNATSTRAEVERKKQEEIAKSRVRKVDEKGRAYGTGRRKCSVARVWIQPGEGRFMVNDKEFDAYFPILDHRADLLQPFTITNTLGLWDVTCTVKGGGVSGQVGAVRLGISRALQHWEPGLRPYLKSAGFLTRDSRVVERKKPGKAKARKSFQWVKR
ncbi:hypothetical protein AXF42_Ash017015 [Apostasia shenzhenica]|uniref:30S ribosomal protein S9, chloroplastic n=1 Tax=Apostasia shenzhenica TaxID=1088818 RepID=A0A2I0B7J8_9ASPA|nr:hypothetical protein AXF42_Ash017015 [Apostasia shenzhenica]